MAKTTEHDAMVEKLYAMGMGTAPEEDKGNIVALLFLLKSRHGYREMGNDVSRVGTQNNVQIVVNGALTREQYMQTLRLAAPAHEEAEEVKS